MYSRLRTKASEADQRRVSVPVTVRTLETMLRLATAHAKLRLAKQVEVDDLDVAVKLLNMTIFNEPDQDEEQEAEEVEDEMQVDKQQPAAGDDGVVPLARKASRAQRARRRGAAAAEEQEEEIEE